MLWSSVVLFRFGCFLDGKRSLRKEGKRNNITLKGGLSKCVAKQIFRGTQAGNLLAIVAEAIFLDVSSQPGEKRKGWRHTNNRWKCNWPL